MAFDRSDTNARKTLRPCVFIGSSVESLDVAYAAQDNLQRDARVTVWTQGVFDLSKTILASLVETLNKSDFGIFVFMPSDAVRLKKKRFAAVRDNVVLELGLFIGKLGVKRTFITAPDNIKDLRVPTDLLGVTIGTYDGEREEAELQAALGPVCNQIRKSIRKLKFAKRRSPQPKTRTKSMPPTLEIHSAMYGARNHRIDVKNAILSELRKGKRNIFVGNQLGGDPTPKVRKDLKIEFRYLGDEYEIRIPEGRDLSFPE